MKIPEKGDNNNREKIDNIELDVDTLAQQISVSRTQLYRKIAALTDMTPKNFVRDIRRNVLRNIYFR
jgi:AraC-like DNA-binding protein